MQNACIEKIAFYRFSNAYNVISTYSLLTYVATNIFTVQLPFFKLHRKPLQFLFDSSKLQLPFFTICHTVTIFFRLHRKPLQFPVDSSNWFWQFLDLPLFRPHEWFLDFFMQRHSIQWVFAQTFSSLLASSSFLPVLTKLPSHQSNHLTISPFKAEDIMRYLSQCGKT